MGFCEKCNKEMADKEFYTYKDGRKTEICKKCLTMHIDNFDEKTYLWLLEKLDVPYIPSKWNSLRDRAYAKNPNLTGLSVFGKYLSSVKIKPWNQYGWADTEKLMTEDERKKEAYYAEHEDRRKAVEERKQVLQEQFDSGEITEAQYKTLMDTEILNEKYITSPPDVIGANNHYNEKNFLDESELPDVGNELTHEDKLYLAMKWGRLYKPAEWVELEKQYNEMIGSFTIEDADSISTLKLLCKTNLKANQAIDCGDVDGFQKLSRVADGLRKSAKFMAVQNKEEKGSTFDSIGEIVLLCEKEGGFIPRHRIIDPFDKADADIIDMKAYNRSLIEQDPTVFKQVEAFIKKREILAEQEADMAASEEEDGTVLINDEDLVKYRESIAEQKAEDANTIKEAIETDEFTKPS